MVSPGTRVWPHPSCLAAQGQSQYSWVSLSATHTNSPQMSLSSPSVAEKRHKCQVKNNQWKTRLLGAYSFSADFTTPQIDMKQSGMWSRKNEWKETKNKKVTQTESVLGNSRRLANKNLLHFPWSFQGYKKKNDDIQTMSHHSSSSAWGHMFFFTLVFLMRLLSFPLRLLFAGIRYQWH